MFSRSEKRQLVAIGERCDKQSGSRRPQFRVPPLLFGHTLVHSAYGMLLLHGFVLMSGISATVEWESRHQEAAMCIMTTLTARPEQHDQVKIKASVAVAINDDDLMIKRR